MFEFRITKYDPCLRSPDGAYARDDWTSIRDVGCVFDGVPLTVAEYERVERAYVDCALAFLRGSGTTVLAVRGLENNDGADVPFVDGDWLSLERVAAMLPRLLREEFWCRLEGDGAFVHIGWDFYMYVGVSVASDAARTLAGESGLFIEPFRSPYGVGGHSPGCE